MLGSLLFAAAHAIIIVPIWAAMAWGILFGALAGSAAGWALSECDPAFTTASAGRAAAVGGRFGIVLWLLIAPVTAADAFLRAVGIAPRFELAAVGVALVLTLGGGAAFGWWRTHRRRGVIAGAVATLALTVAMAGPVPVARSGRAFGIFLVVLPIAAIGGAVLATGARLLRRRVVHPTPLPSNLILLLACWALTHLPAATTSRGADRDWRHVRFGPYIAYDAAPGSTPGNGIPTCIP